MIYGTSNINRNGFHYHAEKLPLISQCHSNMSTVHLNPIKHCLYIHKPHVKVRSSQKGKHLWSKQNQIKVFCI